MQLELMCFDNQLHTPMSVRQRLSRGDYLNLFTAMFTAPSLGKQPIKMPDLKPSVFFFFFLPSSHKRVKGLYQNAQYGM